MEHVIEGCQCTGKKCTKCDKVRCIHDYTKGNKEGSLKDKCRQCANLDYADWSERTRDTGPSREYKKVDVPTRFFSKVQKDAPSGCWLWNGSIKENGYGTFAVNRRGVYAHRWSYEYHKGPIPEGLQIDHQCKVRRCINPDHLKAVDNKTNVLNNTSFSAKNAQKTHCVHGHLYTEENTRRTKKGRRCRTCDQIREKERYIGKPREVKTHCPKGHPYEGEDRCRICQREYDTKYHRNKRKGILTAKHEQTHCKRGHPYNEENTYYHATSGKHCRLCRKERDPRYVAPPKGIVVISNRGYSKQEWRDLKAKYDYRCLDCGKQEPDIKLCADHVIPKSLGGANSIDNRQPLCKKCNCRKQDKIIDFRCQST